MAYDTDYAPKRGDASFRDGIRGLVALNLALQRWMAVVYDVIAEQGGPPGPTMDTVVGMFPQTVPDRPDLFRVGILFAPRPNVTGMMDVILPYDAVERGDKAELRQWFDDSRQREVMTGRARGMVS